MGSQCEPEIKQSNFNLNDIAFNLEDNYDDKIKEINFEISNIKEITPLSGVFDSSYKDFSFDRSRIQKLEKAMYYAKILNISVLNLDLQLKNIVVNALGCEGSLRNCKDGITYFGSKKKDASHGHIINDIVLPLVNKDLATNYRGKHFQISYDIAKDAYFIRDLKLGFGTFYKLHDSLELTNNTLFLIGNCFILVNFIPQEREYPRLRLKVYGKGPGDIFYFNASDYSENYITVGRQETCEVRLQGSLVSKIHCTLFFAPEKG